MPDLLNRLKRPDLSDIHPLKRSLLIFLRYMLTLNLVAVLALQFAWLDAAVGTPIGQFTVMTDKRVLQLSANSTFKSAFRASCRYGTRNVDGSNDLKTLREVQKGSCVQLRLAPGLTFQHDLGPGFFVTDLRTLEVHHFWLISISAALYLITRARIRRSASTDLFSIVDAKN